MDVRTLEGTIFLEWTVKESIGAGADGIVYLVEKNGEFRALKLFFSRSHSKKRIGRTA